MPFSKCSSVIRGLVLVTLKLYVPQFSADFQLGEFCQLSSSRYLILLFHWT